MIKFILLLPLKIIGLLFIAIGALLDGVNRRRIEQAKQEERQRREQYKTERAAQKEQERRERAARIATERAQRSARIEYERLEKEKKRRAAETFKKEQAEKDLYHYREQLTETLKIYNELQREYENSTGPKQTTVYRKLIGINQTIRNIEKQIDKAQFQLLK